MNKKGVEFYLPFLVVLSIIIFTITAYTISSTSLKDSETKTGYTAKYLIQVYDEAEKAGLYLDEATKLSSKEAFHELCSNAGYSNDAGCKKEKLLTGQEYILWNTCPKFNPKMQFREQFKQNLGSYLQNYKSFYPESKEGFKESYEELIKNLKPESIDNGEVKFNGLTYYVEGHRGSTYKVKPVSRFEQPNLELFEQIYRILVDCNSAEECEKKLGNAKVTEKGSELFVKIESKECTIQLVVDKSKPLQGIDSPFKSQ